MSDEPKKFKTHWLAFFVCFALSGLWGFFSLLAIYYFIVSIYNGYRNDRYQDMLEAKKSL